MTILIFDVGDKTGYIDKNAYEYIVNKFPRREWSMTRDYLALKYKNKTRYIHKLVFEAFGENIPDDLDVDHIDRNPLNNTKDNLRIVTRSINKHNSRKSKNDKITSQYLGVSFHKKNSKFIARIYIDKKMFFLGSYENEIHTAYAYDFAKKTYIKNG